jgi:cell fate (sporulation/competence/biofilm development) regulator YlbF (YheA/YmcA/DUF963 family)
MLEERAREIGRLIGQSSEYQAVKRSNDALGSDAEAMALLQTLDGLRGKAQQMMARGEQPTEEMERELESLLQQVQTNASYQRVLVAQENFDKVMGRVNEWILDGIKKGSASPIITLG